MSWLDYNTLKPQELDVLIVYSCYRSASLTIDSLRSLCYQVRQVPRVKVAICENGTGEESVRQLHDAIEREGWSPWVMVRSVFPNRGFAGGNNVILKESLSWLTPPCFFLLLNSDTLVRDGAVASLYRAAHQRPEAGIIGPRLEGPDGTPQPSCFRDRSPSYEFFMAARTGLLSRLFRKSKDVLPVSEVPITADWVSFACALIRREVFQQVGLLDEGFYLYYDDPDFCRRARGAGWRVLYWPEARVVHLQGQSNPVKSLSAQRRRRPRYWYASRARYYAKFYGRRGLWMANLLWTAGRSVSLARELVGRKRPHTCEKEWIDIWTNWTDPLRPSAEMQSHQQ